MIYHPTEDVVMTASPDATIRVWNVNTSQTSLLMRTHDGPVTGLSLHPTGDYLLSSSLDHYWAFSDIRSGLLLTKVLPSMCYFNLFTCEIVISILISRLLVKVVSH